MAAATTDDAFLLAECDLVPEHVRRRAAFRVVAGERPAQRDPRVSGSAPVATPVTVRRPAPAPVRLTRRGVAVLAAAVALVAAVLIGLAWLSAPAAAGGGSPAGVTAATVQVAPGDSLWSIAERVAPDTDPRAEVAVLQRLNHLPAGASLQPGDVLRVR